MNELAVDTTLEKLAKAGYHTHSMGDLIKYAGSMRRLMEDYWKGRIDSPQVERFIEDNVPTEIRIGMKPLG